MAVMGGWFARCRIQRRVLTDSLTNAPSRHQQECGDFKRGACFRATCKFMHNGRPAAEFASQGIPGSTNNGAAGLPTPKAAGAFVAPDHLDHQLYDPNTGFGLFGTDFFGTRYGMIGNLPKIENVRPLCMDFFKQGFCNRRGPHNQGCLFRHDEIEGQGKLETNDKKEVGREVEVFKAEAPASVGVGKWNSGPLGVSRGYHPPAATLLTVKDLPCEKGKRRTYDKTT